MKYSGSCHCGKLSYELEHEEIKEAMNCNCSICRRRGHYLIFVTEDKFRGDYSLEDVSNYTFNKHVINHNFCKTCGCSPFGFGSDGKGNKMISININCFDDGCYIDPKKLKINSYDGKNV